MGFFTIELARLVGPSGQVIAVDVQPKMTARLKRRLARAGLADRVETRLCSANSLDLPENLTADFTLAFAMVHELPNQVAFFQQVAKVSKPGALVLLCEPKGHVSSADFQQELQVAQQAGLETVARPEVARSHAAVLKKHSS
jgi:predicted O-methyltransferase YrrM